jgi:hypothetical protein
MNVSINIKPCEHVVVADSKKELNAKVEAIKATLLPTQELVASVVWVAGISIVETT